MRLFLGPEADFLFPSSFVLIRLKIRENTRGEQQGKHLFSPFLLRQLLRHVPSSEPTSIKFFRPHASPQQELESLGLLASSWTRLSPPDSPPAALPGARMWLCFYVNQAVPQSFVWKKDKGGDQKCSYWYWNGGKSRIRGQRWLAPNQAACQLLLQECKKKSL